MFFNNNYNNYNKNGFNSNRVKRRGHRFRPYSRGRGGHQYRQPLDKSFNEFIEKPKPKFETIVLELNESRDELTEPLLRQHLQRIYGSIKKIWFNRDNSKAFISFYNTLSVDMIVENGNKVEINGQTVYGYPLRVEIPQELCQQTSGDQSFHLCKTNNSSLKSMFPSKEEIFAKKRNNFNNNSNISRNELKDLTKIQFKVQNELLSQLLKANDLKQQLELISNNLLLTELDIERRNRLKDKLQEILIQNGFDCRLHFIGSTVNRLGFRDSDCDLFIEMKESFESNATKSVKTFKESMDLLLKIQIILRNNLKFFIPNPIPSIRCPIIRLDFNYLFGNSLGPNRTALVCDLSLSNGLGKYNSALIRLYTELEPRFQELTILLRLWAKSNGFVGNQGMSSYAFTQLVVFFCQSQRLLPSLDHLRQVSSPPLQPLVINGWNCSLPEHVSQVLWTENQQNLDSIPELLQKFFTFYANFDFTHQVINTKSGLTKHKFEDYIEKVKFESQQTTSAVDDEIEVVYEEVMPSVTKHLSYKLTPILCIEDPIELTHNLCANLLYKTFDKFCDYLIYISNNFEKIFDFSRKAIENEEISSEVVSKTCEKSSSIKSNIKENYWGFSGLCREFDPTLNGYVFPEHFVGFANLELILKLKSKSTKDSAPTLNSMNQLMQTMANNVIDLTLLWLTHVYKIETSLLAKWDLISGQLSPFGEFYIKVRDIDQQVMDWNTRLEFRHELSEKELNELNAIQRETLITDRIVRKFNCESSDIVPLHLHFALVMNCRQTFPTIELAVIDIKPGFEFTKGLMNFMRRLIAGAADDTRLLTVANDLINIINI